MPDNSTTLLKLAKERRKRNAQAIEAKKSTGAYGVDENRAKEIKELQEKNQLAKTVKQNDAAKAQTDSKHPGKRKKPKSFTPKEPTLSEKLMTMKKEKNTKPVNDEFIWFEPMAQQKEAQVEKKPELVM